MRTARFANVAIASSTRRLRPGIYQQAHFSHTRPLPQVHHGGLHRTTEAQEAAAETAKIHADDEPFDEPVAASKVTTPSTHGTDTVPSVALRNAVRQALNRQRLARITPDDPFVASISRTARAQRIAFLERNHELLTSSASIGARDIRLDDGTVLLSWDPAKGLKPGINFDWTRNFAAAYAKTLHPQADVEPVVPMASRKKFVQFVRALRKSEQDQSNGQDDIDLSMVGDFSSMTSSTYRQRKSLPGFLIMVLRYTPDKAAQVLHALHPLGGLPFYMVADVLDFVTRFCLAKENLSTENSTLARCLTPNQAVDFVMELVSRHNSQRPLIRSSTVKHLLPHLDLQHTYVLYHGLLAFDTHMDGTAYLSFADSFAHHGEYETALEAMDLYLDHGGGSDAVPFYAIANKVLRRSILHPQGYHGSNEIISRLLEMGHPVNQSVQNILMANAFDSRDKPTALNIFHLMREQGTDPDSFTYATMVKGLRDSTDETLVRDVLSMAWAKIEESGSDYLAGEVLYHHFAKHVRQAENSDDPAEKARIYAEALKELVPLYTRLYDPTPLEVLGFSNLVPYSEWSVRSTTSKSQPSCFIMALMILAYTRAKYLAIEANPDEDPDSTFYYYGTNYRLYQRFWLVATQPWMFPEMPQGISEVFSKMLMEPTTLNIFIHALGTQKRTLLHAVKVLRNMEAGEVTYTDTINGESHTTYLCPPDLVSWSTLLNAFARHNEPKAAQQCFDTMRTKGIQPDEIAWNALVKAYAVAQDPRGVFGVLKGKERAGYGNQEDDGLVRTLSHLQTRATLRRILQEEADRREKNPDALLLGRSLESESKKKPWAPRNDERVAYQPGVGKRSIQYFDANRTTGLHKEAWAAVEEADEATYAPVGPTAGGRILEGQGSFTLKSEDENDWFEEDDDNKEDGFTWSPMAGTEKDVPEAK